MVVNQTASAALAAPIDPYYFIVESNIDLITNMLEKLKKRMK